MYDNAFVFTRMDSFTLKRLNNMIRKDTTVWEGLSRDRCIKRCAQYKEEIMMKAWHPTRMQMLYEMGYDVEDM
jgi:hypothetical protein